jgi:predicted ribosomally synthesized peptide with SipW-like signal peptide
MKRKYKALLSSACIVVASGAIIVGSTYALFTDSSSVNIAVTSGNVEVKANINNIHTYSAKAVNKLAEGEKGVDGMSVAGDTNSQYVYEENDTTTNDEGTVTTSDFSIGGGLEYDSDTNIFKVSSITPGTKITFNLNVQNLSSVTIKYRTSIVYTTESSLATALNFSLNGWVPTSSSVVDYNNDQNNVSLNETSYLISNWDTWDTDEAKTKVISAEIELPITVANEYQDKTIELEYKVEAVQGNAATTESQEQQFFISDIKGLKSALSQGSINLYNDLIYEDKNNSLADEANTTSVEISNNNVKLNTDNSSMYFADGTENTSMFTVSSSKQLIINGNGEFDARNGSNNSIATVDAGSTLLINGGSYYSNGTLFYLDSTFISNKTTNSKLYISGGYFDVTGSADNSGISTLADNDKSAIVKTGTGTAEVYIGGGTFVGFDPSYYIGDNYKVVTSTQNGKTVYTVVSNTEGSSNSDSSNTVKYSKDFKSNGISLATSIVIPSDITSIDTGAFKDNYPFVTKVTIEGNLTTIGQGAFSGCVSLEKIDLSTTSVTKVVSSAFSGCRSLKEVKLPSTVTTIGGSAFLGCSSLESIDLSQCNGLDNIGSQTFSGCTALTDVKLPTDGNIKTISDQAFLNCTSLETIVIPDSVETLGQSVFNGCTSLKSITLSNSLKSIGAKAFRSCSSLESIVLPDTVTSIGGSAFAYCSSLVSAKLPGALESIQESLFAGCSSLSSIDLPDTVTSIGNNAFQACSSLESIVLPNSLTTIGNNAFVSCSSLNTLTIPKSVTSIGTKAFYACNKLTTIYYAGTEEQWKLITIGDNNNILNNVTYNNTTSD